MKRRKQKPSCVECSTADNGNPKHGAKRARLPEDNPRFCSIKCAAAFGCAAATNEHILVYQEWCETHSCWFDAYFDGGNDTRCPDCIAFEDEESMRMEEEYLAAEKAKRAKKEAL